MTDKERKLLLVLTNCVLELACGDTPDDESVQELIMLGDYIEAGLDADAATPN